MNKDYTGRSILIIILIESFKKCKLIQKNITDNGADLKNYINIDHNTLIIVEYRSENCMESPKRKQESENKIKNFVR